MPFVMQLYVLSKNELKPKYCLYKASVFDYVLILWNNISKDHKHMFNECV